MYIVDYLNYVLEREKVKEIQSYTIRGAVETINAGLWLVGGFQFPQALVMLCNSIELIIKGELEMYDLRLIVDQKLTELEVKEIVSKGKSDNNKFPVDLEYTISIREAIKRIGFIDKYTALIDKWKSRLISLVGKRNDIVHRGHKPGVKYGADIVSVAIPFLAEFLAISNKIFLRELMTPGIYREIEVAQLVDQTLKKENLPSSDYILKALAYKILYTLNQRESLDNYDNEIEEENFLANRMERQLWEIWADGDWVEEFCQICDCVRMFVKVKPYIRPAQGLMPLAVRCPKCGLEIDEDEKYLARFHVNIQKEVADNYFENDFFLEDYNDSDLNMD